MPQGNANDQGGESTNDDGEQSGEGSKGPTPRELRTQLATSNSRVAELERENMLYKAGLGHLSDRQVKAVLRSFDEGETVNAETLKDAVKDLGMPTTAPKSEASTNTTTSTNGEQGNGESGGQSDEEAQRVEDSITGLTQTELAHIMSLRGGGNRTTSEDFQKRLAEAKTQEEAHAVIRTYGPSQGIVSDWDVE